MDGRLSQSQSHSACALQPLQLASNRLQPSSKWMPSAAGELDNLDEISYNAALWLLRVPSEAPRMSRTGWLQSCLVGGGSRGALSGCGQQDG